ncbi:hypothetical protein [Halobacillus trueperi]|uniref:hypothetical protein n=1 Tax=Halobacillus trueperi TaxID=156205 RepID=UPI003735ECBB
MIKKDKLNKIILLYLVYSFGLIIVISSQFILPEKYFIDSNTIKEYFHILDGFKFNNTDGFYNTALFYKYIGLSIIDNRIFQGIIIYNIYSLLLFYVIKHTNFHSNIMIIILMFAWSSVSAIYLGQLTKELIPLILLTFFVINMHKNNKSKIITSFILLVLYAYFFRVYWFIILYFSLVIFMYLNTKFNIHIKRVLLLIALSVVFIASSINDIYLTHERTRVNNLLDSNTMINNPFVNSSVFTDILNWLIVWVQLLLPFNVITNSPIHVLFFLLNIFSIFLLLKFYNVQKNNNTLSIKWSFSFIVGFSLTQGIFEPDYGSYLKHLIVILPMYFYIVLVKLWPVLHSAKNGRLKNEGITCG